MAIACTNDLVETALQKLWVCIRMLTVHLFVDDQLPIRGKRQKKSSPSFVELLQDEGV